MNKDKRKIRAKKKAKQAAIRKQSQTYSQGNIDYSGFLDSKQMTIGVMDENDHIQKTILTDGMEEFLNVIEEYQSNGFVDLYEDKDTPIDGYDVLFKPE